MPRAVRVTRIAFFDKDGRRLPPVGGETLLDQLGHVNRRVERQLAAREACGHARWDENSVVRRCLECGDVLQVKPPA